MSTFTKDAIKKAFAELLEQKPLSKITVKDIVDTCGVNRNTFYYHFESIPDLLYEIVIDISERVIKENATKAEVSSPEDCLMVVVKIALKYKRAVLNIYNSSNRSLFELYLMKACQNVVEQYIETTFGDKGVPEDDIEILVRFYKCECFGQVIDWLNSGMNYNISEQFSRLCKLREGFAEELVKRCQKQ